MRCERAAVENSQRIERRCWRLGPLCHGVFVLAPGLGKMNQQRRRKAVGQGAALLQRLVRVRIDGVRRNRRGDQRVAMEPLQKLLGEPQRVRRRLRVRRRESDDGLAQNASHAALFRCLRDQVLEIVHVGEGRGTAEKHFETRQAGAPANEVRSDVAGFGGKDVFLEPVLQPQVVRDAAEQDHSGVRVGIDQPR